MPHELLQHLPSDRVNGLENKSNCIPGTRKLMVPAEKYIFNAGDKTDNLVLLLEGKVHLFDSATNSSDPKRVVTISELQGPALLSVAAITKEKVHDVDATATTDCLVLLIPSRHLPQIAHDNPEFFVRLFSSLAKQNSDLTKKLISRSTASGLQRVAEVLLDMNNDRSYQVIQSKIAAKTGFSRETVNRALAKLERRGLISIEGLGRGKGCIYTVKKPEQLSLLISGQY